MEGRILVIGGSEAFPGAVYLAGISALRSGAQSVMIMTPEKVAWAINALSPDLMTVKLPGDHLSMSHKDIISEKVKTADVLLLGNGAGTHKDTATLMKRLMQREEPKVVDADAVKVLENNEVQHAILTPNRAEWELLAKHNDISTLVHSQDTVIIQKNNPTCIHAKDEHVEVSVNEGLHKAGMGDVLAGLCAGSLAQGLSLKDAAVAATKTGNEIAELLAQKKQGYYFLASDLVEELERTKTLEP